MARVSLQDMIEDIRFDDLPANWTHFDLITFSRDKEFWDYQQRALRNAITALHKYYEDFADYQPKESADINKHRKHKFAQWYRDNGQEEDLDIALNSNRTLTGLLGDYYPIGKDNMLSFQHLVNRACFWMATGSGKTLVLVKLIEVLRELIRRGEIPSNDILVLTYRDDLIEQLKTHVNEFNAAHSELNIHLKELREYATVKRDSPSLFKERELTVFYYRSDNLSDEQKEKIVDFRNYDDDGKWYILLDEAHKGDKEDSKRQHIYNILSRNGFLFNFSATFTDVRDLVTTACNFNLAEFIKAGYGKHIAILQQETLAFRKETDFSDEEKQKVVLKSLILLAYAKKFALKVRKVAAGMYHNPLLLTLVNSVNTEDADLKLFFRELERIGKGKVSEKLWKAAKKELWDELKSQPSFMFEPDEQVIVNQTAFDSLEQSDILKLVYNGGKPGEIEILVRPSNKQELAFKLKTSDSPFALIKIGDYAGWLKDELEGYEVNESFEDESYFRQLNTEESDINILMGSRSFYEGWDSNRPNVIMFINIGIGLDAKKFILQSIGRGVRIEPVKNKRKRLRHLYNGEEVDQKMFAHIKEKVEPLESLFIFGTNREALKTVIEHLHREGRIGEQQQLWLFVNETAKDRTLLIPTYKLASEPMAERRKLAKFEITKDELMLLKRYVEYVGDDRVMLALHDAEPTKLRVFRESLNNTEEYYKVDGKSYHNIDILVQRVIDYFGIVPQDFDKLKELEDEIRHFKNITVSLKDINELKEKTESMKSYRDPAAIEAELDEKLDRGDISKRQYKDGIKEASKMVKEASVRYDGKRLKIKHLSNHYYVPIVLSDESERIEYIKHVIQERSEIGFLNKLEEYLQKPDSKFNGFDWWLFSKLDESLDEIYIPYYSPKHNDIARFKPDFIFWLQKGKEYFVVFIDPKGTAYTDYQHKVDGYREIFEEKPGIPRTILHNGWKAGVFLYLYTADENDVSRAYKAYWFDGIGKVIERVMAT